MGMGIGYYGGVIILGCDACYWPATAAFSLFSFCTLVPKTELPRVPQVPIPYRPESRCRFLYLDAKLALSRYTAAAYSAGGQTAREKEAHARLPLPSRTEDWTSRLQLPAITYISREITCSPSSLQSVPDSWSNAPPHVSAFPPSWPTRRRSCARTAHATKEQGK